MNEYTSYEILQMLNDCLKNYAAEDKKPADARKAFPNIVSAKFNLAAGKDGPVLKTTVMFDDGTWTRVSNSYADKIELVKAVDPDTGDEIPDTMVASDFSKENGVVAAVYKRLMGSQNPDNPKEWIGGGCGQRLAAFVKNAEFDQVLYPKLTDIRRKRRKAIEAEEIARKKEAARIKRVRSMAIKIADETEARELAEKILKNRTEKKTDNGEYVRPNKPFRDFTQEEKREYWRMQKRASK